MEKLFRDLKIGLIASMVKRDQDLIRQAPAVPRRGTGAGFPPGILFRLARNHPWHDGSHLRSLQLVQRRASRTIENSGPIVSPGCPRDGIMHIDTSHA
jgi:hypothetical protein